MKRSDFKTIDEYISTFPEDIQVALQKVRQAIKKEAPGTKETINYRIPTFTLNGKNFVHFACYSKHIGFYPTPDAISAFSKELSSYKSAKGSVQFPLDQPIPYDLIRKIVKFRVEQSSTKK